MVGNSQARFDKEMGGGGGYIPDQMEGGKGGYIPDQMRGGKGGYVPGQMEGGGIRPNAKADQQPGSLRPNLLTVPETDFTVKETNPDLGKAVDYKEHFDLVEQMTYLFVRVVRARDLLGKDQGGFSDPVSLVDHVNLHFAYPLSMKVFLVLSR